MMSAKPYNSSEGYVRVHSDGYDQLNSRFELVRVLPLKMRSNETLGRSSDRLSVCNRTSCVSRDFDFNERLVVHLKRDLFNAGQHPYMGLIDHWPNDDGFVIH